MILALIWASANACFAQASVLILADVSGPGTSALAATLAGVGNSVTVRPPPENTWTGSDPSLVGFNCVVHLDGFTPFASLSVSSQALLETFVSGGGGFIAAQWDGFERTVGTQTSMNNLVLQLWNTGFTDNCGGCTITYTTVPAQAGHPVLTGIPSPFSFFADGHDAGSQVVFGVNPSTVLMTAPSGGPGVLTRLFGSGRVVNFSHAANYAGTSGTLTNPTIQALYINAVGWACGGPLFAGVGGCPPHQIHGHISTVPSSHSGSVSHQHHGQHGHQVAVNCPSHVPGHIAGVSADDGEWVASATRSDAVNVVGPHPIPGYVNPPIHSAQVGEVVELYGPASGLFLDEADQTPAAGFAAPAFGPLYYTTELPEVRIGDVTAQVLFSGLAPGRAGVWQINVLVPSGVSAGSLPVTLSYGGESLGAARLSVN